MSCGEEGTKRNRDSRKWSRKKGEFRHPSPEQTPVSVTDPSWKG